MHSLFLHLVAISLMFVAYHSRWLSKDASVASWGDANRAEGGRILLSTYSASLKPLAPSISTLNLIETKFFERLSIIQSIIIHNTATSTSPPTTATPPPQLDSNHISSSTREGTSLSFIEPQQHHPRESRSHGRTLYPRAPPHPVQGQEHLQARGAATPSRRAAGRDQKGQARGEPRKEKRHHGRRWGSPGRFSRGRG